MFHRINHLFSLSPYCSNPDCYKTKLKVREELGEQEQIGIVDEAIIGPNTKGRVRFQGTWWPAHCEHEIVLEPGQKVRVVGMNRITLIVEPLWIM
ncbi:MAG TPA: NfeD family protein [Halomicronema sp.]